MVASLDGQTLLIDNFDSFTWNLYQYLCNLGANVTVLRNNELGPDDFPNLGIKNLIISPGPGHPQTDSGISRQAIRYFAGRVPVLGVCMGLECLVDEFGGTIAHAGEIMHGKTSKIRHDGKGIFSNVPQGIPSTRYHSLSASITTIPQCLSITATTEESGVIMAVRHREYTTEGVQYHPESIMSAEGMLLLKNFLALTGGTWKENPQSKVLEATGAQFDSKAPPTTSDRKVPSILLKIHAQRLKDVAAAKATPGTTPMDIRALLSLNLAPPLIPLLPRIKGRKPALMAEIKRASPSKGPIAMDTNAAQQALTYALAGASVISVLTEPTWFKGSLFDMRLVRQAVDHLPDRPAILRKDFIIDEYQISEARLNGADTVLLIVAILPNDRLKALYNFATGIGMEPLVEVNNAQEMQAALDIGAKVIGVNNRNLHDFEVDMGTTTRLSDMCKEKDVVLCALSGITGPEDVRKYVSQGVNAVLIGESLMRATDPARFISKLLDTPEPPAEVYRGPLVKICGIRDANTALMAAEAGVDLIGMIFAPGSKRRVDPAAAREVSLAIRGRRSISKEHLSSNIPTPNACTKPWFAYNAASFPTARPIVVGVFQNQPLDEVIQITRNAQLDLVQLHGNEPISWSDHIPVPVIKVFHLPSPDNKSLESPDVEVTDLTRPGYHKYILLDSVVPGAKLSGGSGVTADWDMAKRIVDSGEVALYSSKTDTQANIDIPSEGKVSTDVESVTQEQVLASRLPVILAGGLTASNVRDAVEKVKPWAVDVSGGVEAEGSVDKDLTKVKQFIAAAKGLASHG